jgi:hypothetical protein
MKLTIAQLRTIIREALEEQGWLPGHWMPGEGEPVDDEDLERLGNRGFLDGLVDEIEENDSVNQGHEEAAKNAQMNRQGDGFEYNQMGRRKPKR